MFKAALVDLDGTLIDSHEANFLSYKQALDEFKMSYDAQVLTRVVGRLAWQPMLNIILPDCPHIHLEVVKRKRTIYSSMISQISVNDALVDVLRILRPSTAIGIVTSASRSSVESILNEKHLHGLFDVIITSEDVMKQKPDPEPYHCAAKLLGVNACECLVFEDSEVGIQAARSFGAQVWNVMWKNQSELSPLALTQKS